MRRGRADEIHGSATVGKAIWLTMILAFVLACAFNEAWWFGLIPLAIIVGFFVDACFPDLE